MQKESNEVGAMMSKLRLGDDEMLIETHIHMKGEESTELEFSTSESLNVALVPKALILMLIYIQQMWTMLLHLQ